jgi:hypothetical protein
VACVCLCTCVCARMRFVFLQRVRWRAHVRWRKTRAVGGVMESALCPCRECARWNTDTFHAGSGNRFGACVKTYLHSRTAHARKYVHLRMTVPTRRSYSTPHARMQDTGHLLYHTTCIQRTQACKLASSVVSCLQARRRMHMRVLSTLRLEASGLQ